jgi:hypothetical protein
MMIESTTVVFLYQDAREKVEEGLMRWMLMVDGGGWMDVDG